MNRREIKRADVAVLVKAYVEAASVHGKAAVAGDYKTANPQANEISAIYRELRDRGRDAQLSLLPLLDDPDADVRGWAAAHALEFAPSEGERVLEELAPDQSMIGLRAQTALREWRLGMLRFP